MAEDVECFIGKYVVNSKEREGSCEGEVKASAPHFEAVLKIFGDAVVDEGNGSVVEIAANEHGVFALVYMAGQQFYLTGTHLHKGSVPRKDKLDLAPRTPTAQVAVAGHLEGGIAELVAFQMYAVHAQGFAAHVQIYPGSKAAESVQFHIASFPDGISRKDGRAKRFEKIWQAGALLHTFQSSFGVHLLNAQDIRIGSAKQLLVGFGGFGFCAVVKVHARCVEGHHGKWVGIAAAR